MSHLKDLTGKTFGRLKIINRVENDKGGRARWLCECQCSNKTNKILAGKQLLNGDVISCGCINQEKRDNKLIGKTFGRWSVLERDKKSEDRAKWICKCSCDLKTIRSVREENLVSGISQSCGCLNREISIQSAHNPINEIFGRLKVIGCHGRGDKGVMFWDCLCECGNNTIVNYGNLKSGHTMSCGCLKKEIINLHGFNTYEIVKDIVKCHTNNKKEFIIDLIDFDRINKYYWYITEKGYPCTNNIKDGDKKYKQIFLHRFLMNPRDDEFVDHIDRNTNNNTRSNLRIVTKSQNCINIKTQINNTSGVVGVNWVERNNSWCARIGINKKRIHLGYYKNFKEAVKVRLEAEKIYHKEFAPIERRMIN